MSINPNQKYSIFKYINTRYNPPEVTNNQIHSFYYGEDLDIFACGVLLFMMVVRSSPFLSSNYNDVYYSRLIKKDKSSFWKIFESNAKFSAEFKGSYYF